MLKAVKGNNLILGLSDMNIAKLKLGQPIKFNTKELGLGDLNIYIFTAKDEKTMKEMLSGQIGPETEFKDTSNIGNN